LEFDIGYRRAMEPRGDLIVHHESMADKVTEQTRRLILSRQLQPGQRIRQAELAELMGVSTMPVREALLRLVSEGMVIADSNRSFTVAMTATPAGIRDIYWIHAQLAGELAARAWDNRTDELISALEGHERNYAKALKTGEGGHTVLFAENWSFHSLIHHAADAPAIALTLKNTLRYFPDFSYDIPGWNETGAQWQKDLLAQFTGGTREGARQVVATYARQSAELYIAALWPDDAEDAPAKSAGRARSSTKSARAAKPASDTKPTPKPRAKRTTAAARASQV
jgi:DNA-binding GntR family transcriptional regulator